MGETPSVLPAHIRFNAPPSWPVPPGWAPPAGWKKPRRWPDPPPGWVLYVEHDVNLLEPAEAVAEWEAVDPDFEGPPTVKRTTDAMLPHPNAERVSMKFLVTAALVAASVVVLVLGLVSMFGKHTPDTAALQACQDNVRATLVSQHTNVDPSRVSLLPTGSGRGPKPNETVVKGGGSAPGLDSFGWDCVFVGRGGDGSSNGWVFDRSTVTPGKVPVTTVR